MTPADLGFRAIPARTNIPHSLLDILFFAVGDRYLIHHLFGKVTEVKQLDLLLNHIQSAFRGAECWDLVMRMSPKGDMVNVYPQNVMGIAWNRDINKTCKKIELYVTHYNLTGQWPENMELQ